MTKLTTERLDEIANIKITEFSDGTDTANAAYQSVGSSEIVLMARQLLAYEQAAKNPVAWRVSSFAGLPTVTFYEDVKDSMIANGQTPEPLYAAPVLPKQPELLSIGELLHRLEEQTGEKWVEESAQPVIPEEKSAIHRTKEPEDIAFNNGFAAGWNCCRSEVISLNETTAQPVSEPKAVGYFSYGSECGFDWHKTEKEAIESAEAAIDDYRGDACDGWSEETDSVCWGVILQQATKVDERPRIDDDKCDPAIDTVCDYALLPAQETNND